MRKTFLHRRRQVYFLVGQTEQCLTSLWRLQVLHRAHCILININKNVKNNTFLNNRSLVLFSASEKKFGVDSRFHELKIIATVQKFYIDFHELEKNF